MTTRGIAKFVNWQWKNSKLCLPAAFTVWDWRKNNYIFIVKKAHYRFCLLKCFCVVAWLNLDSALIVQATNYDQGTSLWVISCVCFASVCCMFFSKLGAYAPRIYAWLYWSAVLAVVAVPYCPSWACIDLSGELPMKPYLSGMGPLKLLTVVPIAQISLCEKLLLDL